MQYDFYPETFLIVYGIILGILFLLRKIKANKKYKFWFIALYALYIQFLIKFTMLPIMILSQGEKPMYIEELKWTQFIPFHFIKEYVAGSLGIKQILGNLVLLMPMVYFVWVILRSKLKKKIEVKTLFICITTSVMIESIQLCINYITNYPNGVMDIDDLILNCIGSVIGILTFRLLERRSTIYKKICLKPLLHQDKFIY